MAQAAWRGGADRGAISGVEAALEPGAASLPAIINPYGVCVGDAGVGFPRLAIGHLVLAGNDSTV